MITDSQILIWGPETPQRPWPEPFRTAYPEPFGADQVVRRMDEAGIASAVLVTPGWELGKNDVTLAAAARFPDRFAVVACIDPDSDPGAQMRALRREPAICGIRLNFNQTALRGMLRDGRAERVIRAAAEEWLPVMVFAPDEPEPLERLMASYPGVAFMVDHANIGKGSSPRHLEEGIERVLRLSQYANVSIKASAFPCFACEPPPFQRAVAAVRRLVSEFGADRCMWGSDLHRLPCPYAEWADAVISATGLSEHEKQQVIGQAIRNVLALPEPGSDTSSIQEPSHGR